MAELKTKPNDASVEKFLNSVENPKRREDAFKLLDFFEKVTGEKAKMWGDSIVGFGQYHYKSPKTKTEGDWLSTGFSPRKQNMTVYIMNGFEDYRKEIELLGKCKTSVSCIYFNKIEDIDIKVLEGIVRDSIDKLKNL